MSNFFRNKGRGSHQLNLSGNTSYYIADVNELNGLVIGTDLVASAYVFDPRTGKVWQLTTGTITSGSGLITAGATDETPAGVPDGTVTNSILRWNGSAWVEESDITIDASGNVSTSGTVTSTNSTASTNKDTGAIVTEGGIGAEGNINAGGNLAAVGSVTGGTGVTATTGDVTATAGNLVATAGVLDVNGTGASDIAGTLGVGTASSTTGVITLRNSTNANTVTLAGTSTSDVATLSSGSGFLIVADVDATYDANDNYAASAGYVRQKVSDVTTSLEWKGFAKVISGTGNVTGTNAFDLSTASSPQAIPASGTQYFDDDETPTQLNVTQANFPAGAIAIVETGTVHRVWKSNGTQFVLQSAPSDADTYGVLYDYIQTPDALETAAIYRYISATPAFTKIGEFRVGQIQNGTTTNTIATWDGSAQTWKEFAELLVTDGNSPVDYKQLEATASHTLILKSTSGVALIDGTLGSDSGITLGGNPTYQITVNNTVTTKKIGITSSGAAGGNGIEITQQATTVGDIIVNNNSTGGDIKLAANGTGSTIEFNSTANNVILTNSPTDAETASSTSAVATVEYVRDHVIQREINASVANAGTQALTVDADAVKFYVKVKGNTTEADAYASEIMAVVNSGSTVDATEYAMVGNAALASIAIARVSATSISCTVTNNTGETATVAIHAIPIR